MIASGHCLRHAQGPVASSCAPANRVGLAISTQFRLVSRDFQGRSLAKVAKAALTLECRLRCALYWTVALRPVGAAGEFCELEYSYAPEFHGPADGWAVVVRAGQEVVFEDLLQE